MFQNMKIGTRLIVLTASLLFLMALIGAMGIRGVASTSGGLRSIYEENTIPLVQLGEVLDVVHHSRALVISGMGTASSSSADKYYNQVSKTYEELNANWSAYKTALRSEEGKKQAANFEQAWKDFATANDRTIELARSGDYEAASDFLKNESAAKFDIARQSLLDLMRVQKKSAKSSFDNVSKSNTTTKAMVIVTLLLGLIVGAGQSWGTIRAITKRLCLMQRTISEVERSSDFSKRVPVESTDEVGETAKSFNELMGVLQESFGVMQGNVTKASEAAHRLSTAVKEVASGSEQGSEDSAAMAATVQELTSSINRISERAREALEISQKSGDLSLEGGKIIHNAATDMTQIATTVRGASRTIEELGQQSNRISTIVQVIKEVADQTNLLALNAAIEAARAGEQGRGFAVVADEVRKLAERTTKATEEITQMIGAIQSSAQAAVATMSTTVVQVDDGATLAHQAGEAINQIRSGAEQVIRAVNDISIALGEQSAASQDIATHVEKVAQTSVRNSTSAVASANEAQGMDELAKSMRETVNRFRI